MKYQSSIQFKFRALFIVVFLVSTIFLILLMSGEMVKITKKISMEYATLYSSEITGDINVHLQREIGLALKASKTNVILNWMENESDSGLKQQAYNEILQFNSVFHDKNFFLVSNKSKNFYSVEGRIPYEKFKPTGVLNRDIPDDIWYFKTIEGEQDYMLNLDVDRFLNTLRAWINVKVVADGKVQGVLGTGIYLEPFIKENFEKINHRGAKSVIINEFGAIQMDSDISNIQLNSFGPVKAIDKTIFEFYPSADFSNKVKNYLAMTKKPVLLEVAGGQYDYVALSPIEGTSWHVVTFFNAKTLFQLNNFLPMIIILLIAIAILGILMTLVVYKTLVQPFEKLNESIRNEGSDPDKKLFGLDRQDEFGVLSNTIQNMKEKLDSYNKDLELEVAFRSAELESAYNEIAINEKHLDRLFRTLPIGIFILDQDKNFTYVNPYFLNEFDSVSEEDFRRRYAENRNSVFANPADFEKVKQIMMENPLSVNFEFELKRFNGETFWADIRLTRTTEKLKDWGYEGLMLNVQVKKDFEMKLRGLATIDRLTGLYNRQHFDQMVIDEISRSTRYDEPLALVMFDLDHFKKVNDTFGHDIGDEVLVLTSKVVSENIRQSDTLARWGGEEFVILMPHTTQDGAEMVAEKIRKAIEAIDHRLAGSVTASFGVAQRSVSESSMDWFKRVDAALFRAKKQGRNRVVTCSAIKIAPVAFIKLIWKKNFESGSALIDGQHKTLFELANGFMDLILEPNSFELEKTQFEKMVNHIVRHFEDEEALMETIHYSGLEEHKKIHQQLIRETLELQMKYDNGKLNAADVFAFLIDKVIVDHLLKEDIKFFSLIS